MRFKKYAAYTLIELLITVAIIGGLTAGGYLIVQNVRQNAAETKLDLDVRQLNQALRVYQTHGGKIPSGLTGEQVLAKLRRTAANPNHPGLKGKLIDPRMTIRWQESNEAKGSSKRAYWNDVSKQFELTSTGTATGVKEFYFGEMPPPLPAGLDENGTVVDNNKDDRSSVAAFNPDKWVWLYEGDVSRERDLFGITSSEVIDTNAVEITNNANAAPLPPPVFSEVTGRYELTWFPGKITLSIPSSVAANAGEIYYHTVGGAWTRYVAPVSVNPGDAIRTKIVSLDMDRYLESSERMERYDRTALKLEIAGQFSQSTFTYVQLGGAMKGLAPLSAPSAPISVTNLTDVPPNQISSSKFQIYWTYDGSDPALATSASRQSGPDFSAAFSPTAVPVSLSHFPQSGNLTIRVKAVALDQDTYRTSDELVLTVRRQVTTLPATTLSIDADKVVMSSLPDPAALPDGARIFYSTGGTDPGSGTEPSESGAVLYAGPVSPPTGLTEFTARTYPPVNFKEWFTAGSPRSIGTGTTPGGFYFAISGGERKLYQFDAASGTNIVRSSECLFNAASVAFLGDSGRVYYVEQGGANGQVAFYDLSTGTHSTAGRLSGAGLDYSPPTAPQNLVGYNNSLFYVAENSDDLIRVYLAPNGSVIGQYKFADISDDLTSLHNVGDIAADTSGTLYISAENAWATYNLKSMSGFTAPVNNPTWQYTGVVAGASGQLFGVRSTEPDKFYDVSKGTAVGSTPVGFSPLRSFTDFAGPLSFIPFALPPGHYAIATGFDDVLRLNLDTGRQYIFRPSLGLQPTALTADNSGGVLYAAGPDPSNPAAAVLVRVNVATGEVTSLGNLNSPSLAFSPMAVPAAMVWYAGALYYLDGVDDLVMVTLSGDKIATQVKVADILEGVSIHPILGKVDSMTIGPDGQLYIASSDQEVLVSYDIANRAGLNVVKDTAPSAYKAITYRSDRQMFGVPSTSEATQKQIFTVDDNTGVQTLFRNVVPPVSISDITGIFDGVPTPVNAEYFATDGTSTRIFRFDPATGSNAVMTAAAPYAMGSIAYDGENQRVYYVRRGGTAVGSYSLADGTHSSAGDLASNSLTYPITSATSPENLTFFNGSLYFIPPNCDDLIRVDINQSNSVADAWKLADINGNIPFESVGDLAVDANGMMYLSSNLGFGRCDLKTSPVYANLGSGGSPEFVALFMAGGLTLFGVEDSDTRVLVRLDTANGTPTSFTTNSPLRNFIDTASYQPRVSITPAGGALYASAINKNTIYSLNPVTGALLPLTATSPVRPESVAYDSDKSVVYYTESTSSSVNIGLYAFDLRSQRHTFAGNLAAAGLGYNITASPRNLLYFNGSLYCIPAGDDLCRLNLTSGVVSGITKFADISGNLRNIGNASALAVDNAGIAWVSQDSGNLLAKFNFYTRSGYTEVNTTDARMTALAFSAANVLYGTHNSTANTIQTVSQSNGERASPVNTNPSLLLRDISGNNSRPRPPLPECYAVGGGDTNIYQFDPATGVTYIATGTAPFTLKSIARDPMNNVLYYLEDASSNWRLGRYSVASNSHSIVATIGNHPWGYPTLSDPSNLFFYGGNLYYFASGSDDLVRISLNSAGTAVTGVVKAADISGDAADLGVVGDVAVDNSGRAWVATGNSVIGHFSMVTLSGWTQLTSSQPNYGSLLFTSTGGFYGSHSAGTNNIYSVDQTTGGANFVTDTFPKVTFWDMAGHETTAPPPAAPAFYAANGTNRLYRIDPVTGVATIVTGTAAYNFDSVGYDQTNGIVYYIEATDSSTRLGKYIISSGAFENIGQFVGNSISGVSLDARPYNLVTYQGALYFVRASSTTSERDDLFRITFTAAGAIATRAKIADLGSSTASSVVAATVDDTGKLFFANSTTLCSYDLSSLSSLVTLKTTFTRQNGLLWRREAGALVGSSHATPSGINPINMTTYVPGTLLTTSPSITITDLASGNTVPPPWESLPPVYLAGDLANSAGTGSRGIARLLSNGSLDPAFSIGSGTNSGSVVRALERSRSGHLLAGGDFTTFSGVARATIARLNGNGSLDTSFAPEITRQPSISSGSAYNMNWGFTGFNQDISLSGTDTNFAGALSPLHGMATSGGFAGFAFQTFNNVNNSGVSVTNYFSQNMTEAGGLLDGSRNGPNLFGPSGSGANGGEHPDRRVVGPWSLRFNNDQVGTITPTTIGFSFSEPVFINQMILGHISKVAGIGSSFGLNILANGSFESGTFSSNGWCPNDTDVNKKPAVRNISGDSVISNWSTDGAHWIQDSSRAANGSRLLYIKPSDQSWNFCVGQWLTVGNSPSDGRQLVTGRTYRVRWSAVTLNQNLPTGAGATVSRPAVEYGWTKPDGSNGFAELQNVRDDVTGLPAVEIPAANWESFQWRNFTGYFVAPAISSSTDGMNFWLSQVRVSGATENDTSGMLFDNVRLEEMLTTTDAFEHVFVRAFNTTDGTGAPVAADSFANISNMLDPLLGTNSDPLTVGDLNNLLINSSVAANSYHAIGNAAEAQNRYGKVRLAWETTPVRSVAISFWASSATTAPSGQPDPNGAPVNAGITASMSNLTFRRAAGLSGMVWAISEQSDGKILIGGNFTTVNGAPRKNIARLNADGTLDTTFDPGAGPDGEVCSIKVAPDGSILAGGDFTTWNGSVAGAKVVHLTASGARNTGWTSPVSVNRGDVVRWIDVSGTSVYIGGKFSSPRNGIARLSMTGDNDTTFATGTGTGTSAVWSGYVESDGKVVVAGDFSAFNATARNRIARLNTNGSLDSSLAPSPGFNAAVYALMRLPGSGYTHAGGAFSSYNGNTRSKVTVYSALNGASGVATWAPDGMSINAIYSIK